MFAPRDRAREIIEQVVDLYAKISGQLSRKIEYTVYSVLRVMIDAFLDDENKYKELISMLDENTSAEASERFVSLEIMHNDLETANSTLEIMHNDLEIAHSNLEAAHSDLEIAHSDLRVAESRIRELEAKVEELEGQLDSK